MKRKLNENDVPTVQAPEKATSEKTKPDTTFESFGLDPRLLQAISKSQFSEPTPVQAKVIPLALEGKDILAKSHTGTGKTAAYTLPIIQTILLRKAQNSKEKTTSTLILTPTRELSDQITRVCASFAEFCSKEVRILNLNQRVSDAVLNAKLQEFPDIVVSTPGRARQLLENGSLTLFNLRQLVIDEADVVLSYGNEEDMKVLADSLPNVVQTFLVSATLTPEVDQLKTIFCRDPITVKIEGNEEKGGKVTQYMVKCSEEDKFLLIYVILKLKLLTGKSIVFVADVDRSYRLKLYLEQYGIKSCVLNSELPVNSRLRVVEEFNKGIYDILIAADEQEVIGGVHRSAKKSNIASEDEAAAAAEVELTDEDEESTAKRQSHDVNSNSNNHNNKSKDFGVSRGIDFQNVSWVLNFDLPSSSKSYTHRIGRTARAGQSGTAISFVIPREEYRKHKPTWHPSCRNDEKTHDKIVARQTKKGNEITPFRFDMDQAAAFRYRMNDALRAVTRVAVREARAREIKQELIRSEKLRRHFQDNPNDLHHLRRTDGGALGGGGIVRVQTHLRHVPEYLKPEKSRTKSDDSIGFVGLQGDNNSNKKRKRPGGFKRGSSSSLSSRSSRKPGKNDPLKSFRSSRKN